MLDDVVGAEPAPARVVAGRYRLGTEVGRGGVAVVHRAVDLTLGRDVALKMFHRGQDAIVLSRFGAEATALARLSHPGLVSIFDAGVDGGQLYLVMQLVDGDSLRDRLADGPLPPADAVLVGARLAAALAHVHANGVVHRDVKPANIVLDAGGAPHLADFGIALLVDAARMTGSREILGTAAYLAPEQILGTDVGTAADVYSLGLVLLECLTGRLEYPGATRIESAVARLHRPPRIPAELPAEFAAVLRAMTVGAARARPSAAECADRLRRIGSGAAVPADSPRDNGSAGAGSAAAGSPGAADSPAVGPCAVGSAAAGLADSLRHIGSAVGPGAAGLADRLRDNGSAAESPGAGSGAAGSADSARHIGSAVGPGAAEPPTVEPPTVESPAAEPAPTPAPGPSPADPALATPWVLAAGTEPGPVDPWSGPEWLDPLVLAGFGRLAPIPRPRRDQAGWRPLAVAGASLAGVVVAAGWMFSTLAPAVGPSAVASPPASTAPPRLTTDPPPLPSALTPVESAAPVRPLPAGPERAADPTTRRARPRPAIVATVPAPGPASTVQTTAVPPEVSVDAPSPDHGNGTAGQHGEPSTSPALQASSVDPTPPTTPPSSSPASDPATTTVSPGG